MLFHIQTESLSLCYFKISFFYLCLFVWSGSGRGNWVALVFYQHWSWKQDIQGVWKFCLWLLLYHWGLQGVRVANWDRGISGVTTWHSCTSFWWPRCQPCQSLEPDQVEVRHCFWACYITLCLAFLICKMEVHHRASRPWSISLQSSMPGFESQLCHLVALGSWKDTSDWEVAPWPWGTSIQVLWYMFWNKI